MDLVAERGIGGGPQVQAADFGGEQRMEWGELQGHRIPPAVRRGDMD
jgi:hypothetical protein